MHIHAGALCSTRMSEIYTRRQAASACAGSCTCILRNKLQPYSDNEYWDYRFETSGYEALYS